ncbi:MAG: saccharopine dehydrogenase NADP-binding domain-containing protein [Candidatus Thermoplasmatota archaeon]|nr:saccharopine dehydrogenase NADP-binding domain-containing protein [Candidatus Thermoplasmatota archaeon]
MKVLVLGAGMMGRAIAYDLMKFSNFDEILLTDKNTQTCHSARRFLKKTAVKVFPSNADRRNETKKLFENVDVAISALPYRYNYTISKIALETHTHLIDLGGNTTIVQKQRSLFSKAKQNKITMIPDSGLAPGLVSIITRDIVDYFDTVDVVKIRVGGLPRHPQPPFKYQIVFSPYGLINEYVEDAIVLDHGKILQKKSLTELETLRFPAPFGTLEAFLTSGGCSILPITYQKIIGFLDYKTIRYPGHCEKIRTLLDLGLADQQKITCQNYHIAPRDVLAALLLKHIPTSGEDVILLKVISQGVKKGKKSIREYVLIDYFDTRHNITAMMRMTGYPVSITAQMIENGTISARGVFCPEEIIPPRAFFKELEKRDISLCIRKKSVIS